MKSKEGQNNELFEWNGKPVVCWGAGVVGKRAILLLKNMEIKIDYICDSNADLWGNMIMEDVPKCASPKDIYEKIGGNAFCFILMGTEKCVEVVRKAQEYGWEYLTYDELLKKEIVFDYYFRNKAYEYSIYDDVLSKKTHITPINNVEKKVAVYKCITGGYDDFSIDKDVIDDTFDYYLITDNKPNHIGKWKYIDIDDIISDRYSNRLRARFCKINGARIFYEYDYSIFLDGNVTITGDIEWMLSKIGITGMAMFKHPQRQEGIFEEAVACIQRNKDKEKIIQNQMVRYLKEGMPRNYGLFETTCLVRNHRNSECIKIMDDWWEELSHYSIRDQLSIMYCIWKHNYKYEDVGCLGDNVKNGPGIAVKRHNY